jgi:hypothetical protein
LVFDSRWIDAEPEKANKCRSVARLNWFGAITKWPVQVNVSGTVGTGALSQRNMAGFRGV